jgi:nicotinate-nucleotide adenylyltransferase
MNVCIYAGTFNPIHIAHLAVAEHVRNEIAADKIIFIPSFSPPHKNNDIIDPLHRLNMVKLAVEDNAFFEASDIEFHLEEPSYSFHTIKKLYETLRIESKINFIIGMDAFERIDSWYNAEKLADLVRFVVVPRSENIELEHLSEKIKLKNIDYIFVKAPFIDVSSTLIREKLNQGKSIKYLVADKVEKYINENNLFRK